MKITIFISQLSGGGAERVACNLANYLANNGNQVTLLSLIEESTFYDVDANVKIAHLMKKEELSDKVNNVLLRFRHLKKYMKNNQDLYIGFLEIPTISLLLMKRYAGCPIIVSERNYPETYPFLIKNMLKLLCKNASGYVFQTKDAEKWFGKRVEFVQRIIIPNAINPDCVNITVSPERKKEIVFVGRFTKQKNPILLLNAFIKIANIIPEYSLVLFGQGPLQDEIEEIIKNNKLNERILIKGYKKNIINEINGASLFVLPSDYEGMPNALMEAMALGIPCISTDCPCGGPNFLIENGKNGFLVPIGDVEHLSRQMLKVLTDEELLNRISVESRKICSKLSPNIIYNQWLKFIEEVVNDNE